MKVFVADTMAVILWLEKRRMPQKVKDIFVTAEAKEVVLYIPGMVLAEIGYLSEKGRVEVTLQSVLDWLGVHDNILIHSLDGQGIKSAFEITDIPELHDRLIAASGRMLNCPVITNDPKIVASEFISALWD